MNPGTAASPHLAGDVAGHPLVLLVCQLGLDPLQPCHQLGVLREAQTHREAREPPPPPATPGRPSLTRGGTGTSGRWISHPSSSSCRCSGDPAGGARCGHGAAKARSQPRSRRDPGAARPTCLPQRGVQPPQQPERHQPAFLRQRRLQLIPQPGGQRRQLFVPHRPPQPRPGPHRRRHVGPGRRCRGDREGRRGEP